MRKLGIYAHEKLAVCNLGWAKLRGVFCCVGAVCALVALSVSSSLSFFSAFVHLGDFCRDEGTQIRVLFKIYLHIPLWCGGVRGLTM